MSAIERLLSAAPVIPVLVIEDPDAAVPLARALIEGGLPVLEITLRTPGALAALENICRELPQAMVGAGTVTRPEEFRRLSEIGAAFAISPGATPALYEAASLSDLPFLPGVATASELMEGLERGYDCFKFFPAEASGGVVALKSLYGPFPTARFCPTGGITVDNAGSYLALPNVLTVGGSWLATPADVADGDWERIGKRARAAVQLLG